MPIRGHRLRQAQSRKASDSLCRIEDNAVSSLKQKLITEAEKIPGVKSKPSPVQGGTALHYKGKEFAHFHHDNELDLKLGKITIQQENLSHPQDSIVHPTRSHNSPWIELHLQNSSDIKAIARLVKLAVSSSTMNK